MRRDRRADQGADGSNGFERLGARFPPNFNMLVDHGQIIVDGAKLIGQDLGDRKRGRRNVSQVRVIVIEHSD